MTDSNRSIGIRVKNLRRKKHLTQQELGELTSSCSKHISEIERGITGISIDMQIQLSDALGCSVDFLLKGEEYRTIETELPMEIVRILKSKDEAEIATLLAYLDMYTKLRKQT